VWMTKTQVDLDQITRFNADSETVFLNESSSLLTLNFQPVPLACLA